MSHPSGHTVIVRPLRAEFIDIAPEPEADVSVRVVQALVEAVEKAGVSRQRFLKAAQLEAATLEQADARLPRSRVWQSCETALDLTGDPAFGLHWAERLTPSSFNLVSLLVTHANTIRQAFETLFQYGRLLTDQLGLEVRERERTVEVRYARSRGASLRIQRLEAELSTLGLYRMLRALNADARPERVTFEYSAPLQRAEYTRLFDGAERFDQPFTGIVFDRTLMNSSSPRKDEDLHTELRALAERRIVQLVHQEPYAQRVREILIKRAAPHEADMNTVARVLGFSTRSLRRHLAAENTSYSAIANDTFATLAKRLLRDERRTLQETAYQMGFANLSSFHRAFKRWTGTTPRSFRSSR
jgi:AraC-like DNA-binding protein